MLRPETVGKECVCFRQEDTRMATASTLSPVDVSANYCVVTGNSHEVPLYGDVVAVPRHSEVYGLALSMR